MPNRKKTYDLARSLVALESEVGASSVRIEPATARVYERLRRQLGAPVGVDGFRALASRALALAKAESTRLSAVQMTPNGGLHGLDALESEADTDDDGEAGIILIAHLLGLFVTFLGEATTLSLLEDLRLQGEGSTGPETTPEAENFPADQEGPMDQAFDDLLVEIGRLRTVSENIEALAVTHPGMEDGLLSVAGNIRSIATVLDVFTLIRSRAGGPSDELPNPQTNRYMN